MAQFPCEQKEKAVRSNSYMKIDHLFRHFAGMKERHCPVRDVINKPQNLHRRHYAHFMGK